MGGHCFSLDVADIATGAHGPDRTEGKTDYECEQKIEGRGKKHHRTPVAGLPVRNSSGGAGRAPCSRE